MKIATQLPSNLASSVDIVDRNVVSNIEIHQEAMYPLEPSPDLFLVPAVIVTPVMRQSFFAAGSGVVANAAALTLLQPTFGRGLWIIRIFVDYSANYGGGVGTGFNLSLSLPGGSPALLDLFPPGAGLPAVIVSHSIKLLLEDDTSFLQAFLAANGAGNSHQATISVVAEKYL